MLALEAARLSAVALAPVVPALSERVLLSLGETRTKSSGGSSEGGGGGEENISWQRDARWGGLKAGTALPVPSPVFSRIELSEEEGGAAAAAGAAAGGGGGGAKKKKPQQPKKQQQQPKKKKEETAAPAA